MTKTVGTIQDDSVDHPLQSAAWGEFRKAMGVNVVRFNNWQLTFHRIPFTPWSIGYFPKGPVPTTQMIKQLINLGHTKRAIYIQLEPNVTANHLKRAQLGQEISLKHSHHPLFTKYTFVIDLVKSEEELLKSFHPKTRYNIRLAQKHGAIVKEDNSPEAFSAYLKLNRETTARQGFYAHDETYHRKMWEIMSKANIAHLFTATFQGKILAAWIVFVWKDTIYYPYGASSRENREVMAPNLMLWEIIRWGKSKKLKFFDLWGALGPNPNPTDPWYGFHRFKEGYCPKLVEFIGSFDLVINPFLYQLYILADRVRWIFLKLR